MERPVVLVKTQSVVARGGVDISPTRASVLVSLAAVGTISGCMGVLIANLVSSGDTVWVVRLSLAVALIWLFALSHPLDYYNPFLAFMLYLFARVAGAVYSIEPGFQLSARAAGILVVSIAALLLGATFGYLRGGGGRREPVSAVIEKAEVVPNGPAGIWISVGFLAAGILLSVWLFLQWGSAPLLSEGAEDARVDFRAGRGYAVMPAQMMLEVGALQVLAWAVVRKRRSASLGGVTAVVLAVTVLLGFGYRQPAIRVLLQAFVIFSTLRFGGLRWRHLIPMLVGLFLFLGTVGVVRHFDVSTGLDRLSVDAVGRQAYWRLGMVHIVNLDRVAAAFPEQVDFLYGATYAADMTSLLPGAQQSSSVLLKHLLGLEFRGGGVVPTWAGDLYVNFGWVGVIFGSLVWGYGLTRLGRLIRRERYGVMELVWITNMVFVVASMSGGLPVSALLFVAGPMTSLAWAGRVIAVIAGVRVSGRRRKAVVKRRARFEAVPVADRS